MSEQSQVRGASSGGFFGAEKPAAKGEKGGGETGFGLILDLIAAMVDPLPQPGPAGKNPGQPGKEGAMEHSLTEKGAKGDVSEHLIKKASGGACAPAEQKSFVSVLSGNGSAGGAGSKKTAQPIEGGIGAGKEVIPGEDAPSKEKKTFVLHIPQAQTGIEADGKKDFSGQNNADRAGSAMRGTDKPGPAVHSAAKTAAVFAAGKEPAMQQSSAGPETPHAGSIDRSVDSQAKTAAVFAAGKAPEPQQAVRQDAALFTAGSTADGTAAAGGVSGTQKNGNAAGHEKQFAGGGENRRQQARPIQAKGSSAAGKGSAAAEKYVEGGIQKAGSGHTELKDSEILKPDQTVKLPDAPESGQTRPPEPSGDARGIEAVKTVAVSRAELPEKAPQLIVKMVEQGESKMKISLHPRSLGYIQIELTTEKTGVNIRFIVGSEEVKSIMEQSFHDIRQAVSSSGIQTGHLHVDVTPDFAYRRDPQHKSREPRFQTSGDVPAGAIDEDSVPAVKERSVRYYGYNSMEMEA